MLSQFAIGARDCCLASAAAPHLFIIHFDLVSENQRRLSESEQEDDGYDRPDLE